MDEVLDGISIRSSARGWRHGLPWLLRSDWRVGEKLVPRVRVGELLFLFQVQGEFQFLFLPFASFVFCRWMVVPWLSSVYPVIHSKM